MSSDLHQDRFYRVFRGLLACSTEAGYAVDEKGLFQSVCNIMVRTELFQSAWFAYAGANGAVITKPLAYAGDADGFPEELERALAVDAGQDFASVALRTGQPCWIADLAAQTAMEATRAAMLGRGQTSVIAVPVSTGGAVYGVLTLCYNDPDRYGESVVSLLKEHLVFIQTVFARRPSTPRVRSAEFEAELRDLLDVMPLNLGLTTAEGQLLHINRRIIDFAGYSLEDHLYRGATTKYNHPEDFERVSVEIANGFSRGVPFSYEARQLRRQDQQYRWMLIHVIPIHDESGRIIRWLFAGTDIEERKRAEEQIRQSEAELLEAQRISHTGSWKHDLVSDVVTITPEMARIFGIPESASTITAEVFFSRLHPEDRPAQAASYRRARCEKADFESDYRIIQADGSVRYIHNIGHPKFNRNQELVEFVGTVIDVTAAKYAEQRIRESEREARQLLDLSPLHITLFGQDGNRLYNNRAALDYYGLSLDEWKTSDSQRLVHPQDRDVVDNDLPRFFQSGSLFEIEVRLKRSDGQYRWFHYRFSPLLDEQGRITRWYAAGTDIDDRKASEQRLREENVSLREEIDKTSMFEEIVGTSESVKKVVSRISKVAPTDSSVLITGETGTGKELVARAIHRRSRRCPYAFVTVNCAAIPPDLIASELFGHEKGAFTGATQRRLGCFELADKGTIFLDEVGELPAETQVALLRVLQEREFERIGGTATIHTDVRVIAATNRDLEAAIAKGTFRSDLFYRLNVFPIELPPLRKRREDIPLLVTYFLNRYARKAGRHFTTIDRNSLDLIQGYGWPGNIRELQNVIERSVIVSEGQTFSVDESWLSSQAVPDDMDAQPVSLSRDPAQERALIEAALLECKGRVYGPAGAAAKLGVPRTTLESKIRALKVNKNRFRE